MEQFKLEFDNRIAELEKQNRWQTVADIVFQQWEDAPNDINRLLCAGTQLWYTLLMMDNFRSESFPPNNIEYVLDAQLQKRLMDVTRYGFQYFGDNPIFNAYFGYMIAVMPYFFLDYGGDYQGWKDKGIDMMHRSYNLDPDSPFTKAMSCEPEHYGKRTPFYNACKELWSLTPSENWGDSEVQQYFFRILNGDSCT